MKLYFESLKMHFKALIEYKISFTISFFSQFLVFFSYYFIILALFSKFSNIKGFTLYEVLLTFAIIQFGYSINEVFGRGIDKFDTLIVDGEFDRLLVRPKNILLQVLCSKCDLTKISRTIQSIIIFVIAINNLNLVWNTCKIITVILMLISSITIFFAIFLLMASYCFYTVQGLEVRNLFTDGGKHMAQYPIGIYKKGMIIFFTYVIPYAFVNYYPLLYVLGKVDNVMYMFTPLIVIVYLIPSLLLFKIGIKKYSSTGS